MLVHLLTTALGTDPLRPYQREDYRRMLKASSADRFRVHKLTDDAACAEMILFVGAEHGDYRDVRSHPLLKRWREKCFLFDSADCPVPFLPGVYASIEARYFDPTRTRSGAYLRVFENQSVVPKGVVSDSALLYSFVGSLANHRVRSQLAKLTHQRGYIKDTSKITEPLRRSGAPATEEFQYSYGDMLSQSKFVLCPRGFGSSSWRLFEAMKAGRVPVIISDSWIQPEGPKWSSFSLRVRESDVMSIPSLLERMEDAAPEMGNIARLEFENWYDEPVFFHRTVEACASILRERRLPERFGRFKILPQLLKPSVFRQYILSSIKRKLRGKR